MSLHAPYTVCMLFSDVIRSPHNMHALRCDRVIYHAPVVDVERKLCRRKQTKKLKAERNTTKETAEIIELLFLPCSCSYRVAEMLCSVGILASSTVVCVVGFTKTYKRFVYRLLVYLMVIMIVHAIIHIVQFAPIEVEDDKHIALRKGGGWKVVCEALGYLDVVVSWMGNLIIAWTIGCTCWH